jgi:hypothetical protein
MTRWFFDTEFIDTGRTIDLISIGMISEDGRRTYSACLIESWGGGWSEAKMGPWHIKHVLPNLPPPRQRKSAHLVAEEILGLVAGDSPEFWAYVASYDWVALCQLVTRGGRLLDLPISWPRYVCDLKLLMHLNGVSKKMLPAQEEQEHDALADAKWVRDSYLHIQWNIPCLSG